MIKKIRFLIVGIVMLLAIVLLISKPRESEAAPFCLMQRLS